MWQLARCLTAAVALGASATIVAGCGGGGSAQGSECAPATFVSPGGVRAGGLLGVDALGEADVWAVGIENPTDVVQGDPLILHGSDGAWTVTPSPNPDPGTTALWDVGAASDDAAWAVGSSADGALIVDWDGSEWTRAQTPDWSDAFLLGVDAISPTDVWAVGGTGLSADDPESRRPLIAHWDGSRWSEADAPVGEGFPYILIDVSAVTESEIWAVGGALVEPVTEETSPIVLRFDGEQWEVVPWTGASEGELESVSSVDSDDVWVAGWDGYLAHWDGSAWENVPRPPNPDGHPDGVASSSPEDVWALGVSDADGWPQLLHRTGSAWERVPAPDAGELYRLSPLRSGGVWAVGESRAGPDHEPAPFIQRACPS